MSTQPELLACPFCASEITHIKSWAKSFDPPRLYHEWHHDGRPCPLNQGHTTPFIVASATDDPEMQRNVVARWNTRAPAQCTLTPDALADPDEAALAKAYKAAFVPGTEQARVMIRYAIRAYLFELSSHKQAPTRLERRPEGSNADEWHLFLTQFADNRATHPNGLTYLAVQIAEAIEAAAAQCAPQPSGDPVAFVPVHPRNGELWMDTFPAGRDVSESRTSAYPLRALYGRPAVSCAAREAIARIIHPQTWTEFDKHMIDINAAAYADDAAKQADIDYQREYLKASLTKADAILALPAAGGEASKREADLREALRNIRAAITEADPAVLCCTLWMPNRISPAETVVDHIDAALSRKDG